MPRGSQEYDAEAARREPLLGRGSSGGAAPASGAATPASRGMSPERPEGLHAATTPGAAWMRLSKRSSTTTQEGREDGAEEPGGLVLKERERDEERDAIRELEVEVVAGAVAEAVAEAVQEAVAEAVHDAVQQAIEDNVQFDVRSNVYTLVAVTGVILFWRGVWQTWDALFGTDSLASNLGSLGLGLVIMLVIRFFNLPLVEGLPGG